MPARKMGNPFWGCEKCPGQFRRHDFVDLSSETCTRLLTTLYQQVRLPWSPSLMKIKAFGVETSIAFLCCLLLASTAGATNYTLTVSAQGSGTVTKNPTNSTYPSGVTVIVTAVPNAGWYFANWSGDANSSVNPLNVVMNANLAITGNFLAFPTYTLTLV